METEFPKSQSNYLTAKDFQDTEITLTYKGWDKKHNEDRMKDGKLAKSWVDCLDYCLKYSYPEKAVDKAMRPIIDEATGQQKINGNYDPKYPQGYSIVYIFEEGQLESGSAPLFNAFKRIQPKPGDKLTIMRTGTLLETKWFVCHANQRTKQDVPERDIDDFKHGSLEPDADVPF